ncbi:DUF4833 domain-containing protein [Pseudooceanicola sp. LIPI14-2-Ac024]|uniref:DUF4833 domain-containing protein n=1 Tax=Pseudooceanicola sp. LIPI14-2-Ac024 TaxID=3344875 RepID=UPI0035D13186
MVHHGTSAPAPSRRLVVLLFALLGLLIAALAGPAEAAPSLTLENRATASRQPVINPAFQVPNDAGQVFYIQRSPNANTVVYGTRVAGGQIDSSAPVSAYWRRFNNDGGTKGLSTLERNFAYGVNAKANGDGTYRVTFKALPSKTMTLRMEGGRPALFMPMGDAEARLIYAYLDVDDGGLVPSVTGLKIVGQYPSGQYVTETYRVKGGEL